MNLTKEDILAHILIHGDIEVNGTKTIINRPDFNNRALFPKIPPNYSPHKIELDPDENCVRIWRVTDAAGDRPSLMVINVFTGIAEMKTKEIRGTSADDAEESKEEAKVEKTEAAVPEKKAPKKKEAKAVVAQPPAPAAETFE